MDFKTTPLPSQDRLNEIFEYDPNNGNLIWKIRTSNRINIGDIAGCINTLDYRTISIKGTAYLAHRIVYAMHHGPESINGLVVDHRDNCRLNNRLNNLRAATHAENLLNKFVQSNNRLGVRGVVQIGNRFKATIQKDRVHERLGSFANLEDAIVARNEAVERLHGRFAKFS